MGLMNGMVKGMLVLTLTVALSGCLYPKDRLAQNLLPPKEAVRNVQQAIDQYQADNGLLPIKNAEVTTPAYEKFIVDFAKLLRMNYIGDVPAAAFEKGGRYYFLIQNEEDDPTVKLMSVVVFQQINDLQSRVDAYRAANGGLLPVGDEAYPSFRYLDFGKLGGVKTDVRSVYSRQPMNVIVHENGTVYADYGIDVRKAVEEEGGTPPEPGGDLRQLLVAKSDFVPVKSPAYYWVNGDPQASLPRS
ncbi:hypothetical protein BG53_02290 [Paenibacillus darwinianus]|uniref:Lipoprotein n=1 Tax=Paenibacillus darwinianus TaxID=1380763 RepID=A0A9W5S3Z2_9BACL|nr:hypothetical protein [Paenibacillus darwinianus]EXX91312.1 hypothetical protein BG52_10845 [Paenibacillus darwinianus]EXX92190.1 hypothetical protein BG53_02290 [Paenibacillus darwinianus]EXX92478.1 hypothetical protein CH50_11295 [Paenibacillus darwinianus]